MESKHPWKNDVAVLMIFFIRDDCFEKSFAAVKEARPRRLLLWQDGPRNEKDMEGIEKCRKIAEDIDWDCEVHRCYNEKNFGCDPSTFYSHKWAFSIVDKCIILEDDVVPGQSFFPYCKELLDKYENDTRINKICGMNQVKNFYCQDSYFFSATGSVWGWATWKRVADTWEENYEFLDDEYNLKRLMEMRNQKSHQDYHKVCLEHKAQGVPHWETVESYARFMQNQLCIVPSINLVKNVGLGENSTHSNTALENVPKEVREACYHDAQVMEFPLKHPKYIFENVNYRDELLKISGEGHPWIRFVHKTQSILLRIKSGNFKSVIKGIKRRLKIK